MHNNNICELFFFPFNSKFIQTMVFGIFKFIIKD